MKDLGLDDLMIRVSEGDKIAFRMLAHQFAGRMFGLAYRLMGNHAANAEDAVQDALIKLWVSAPNYQPKGRAESYILTIVYRCCMDLYRQQRLVQEIPDTMTDPGMSVENELIHQDMRLVVMRGIDGLPPRQRDAILLSYFQGHSNRHIADILAVSEKAVESLLVRARAALGIRWQDVEDRPLFDTRYSHDKFF